jgi:lipoyl synthase
MPKPKPDWLRIKIQSGKNKNNVEKILLKHSLHTVCEEAKCPNLMECFNKKTATFMILGNNCTRHCTFCNVEKGNLVPVDSYEPEKVSLAVEELGLKYAVITSVTRDDLPDGGSGQFYKTIIKIKEKKPEVLIEVLIPDFKGELSALLNVIKAKPDVINHNIETVKRLYDKVRPEADYKRSLQLIKNIKNNSTLIYTKSGIMVGLGESVDEVVEAFNDLFTAGCDLLTIGQYLAPSKNHHPVVEYIHPDIFSKYKEIALDLGFKYVASGPFVRSSYNAESFFYDH